MKAAGVGSQTETGASNVSRGDCCDVTTQKMFTG